MTWSPPAQHRRRGTGRRARWARGRRTVAPEARGSILGQAALYQDRPGR